jgi:abhydrolase domain-containing protein 6
MRHKICLVLALAVVMSLSGCAGFKQSLFNKGLSVERWRSSLEEKKMQVNDLSVSYLERQGSGETIVLLHGFSADKDNWVRFVRYLPETYRVIAIDLPGHGSTTRDWNSTYSIDFMTQGFARTVDALHLDRFHLAGNSMGGYVSTLYSASHPDRVLTLCLVDPAGIIKSPQPSDREISLAHGVNPLVPKDIDQFYTMLEYAFYHQPYLPWPARSVTASRYLERSKFNEKMWADLMETRVDSANYLKDIHMPVLLMWGDRDRIIHVSTVSVFQKGLPQVETLIYKDCGHMPMLEIPKQSALDYAAYLKGKHEAKSSPEPKPGKE